METQRLQFVHTIAGPRTLCEKLLRKLCEKLYEKRCGFFVHTIAGPRTLCEKLLRKLCEKLCGFVCGFCSPILAWRKQCQKMSPLGRVKKNKQFFTQFVGQFFTQGSGANLGAERGPKIVPKSVIFTLLPAQFFTQARGGTSFSIPTRNCTSWRAAGQPSQPAQLAS